MVEEAIQRHGKVPDTDRLFEFVSEPLPSIRWDGYSQEIMYLKTGDATYQLNYIDSSMFFGDIMIYSSSTPKKGWYRVPF